MLRCGGEETESSSCTSVLGNFKATCGQKRSLLSETHASHPSSP